MGKRIIQIRHIFIRILGQLIIPTQPMVGTQQIQAM